MARPWPVLPLVGSMMVPPGLSSPSRSAASIIGRPMRSLTEPPGLSISSLARMSGWRSAGPRSRVTRDEADERRLADEVEDRLRVLHPRRSMTPASRVEVGGYGRSGGSLAERPRCELCPWQSGVLPMPRRPHARGRWSSRGAALVVFISVAVAIGPTQAVAIHAASPQPASPTPAVCPAGWQVAPSLRSRATLSAIDGASPDDAWAVGSYSVGRKRSTLIQRWDGQDWTLVPAPSPGKSDAFSDVDVVSATDAWAVGSYSPTLARRPYAAHLVDGSWRGMALPSLEKGPAVATGVVASPTAAIAVGYAFKTAGQRPLGAVWNGSRWRRSDPPLGTTENGALVTIGGSPDGTAWAVGWTTSPTGMRPLLVKREAGAWSRYVDPPITAAGGTLTDVAQSVDGWWAVGYRTQGTVIRPIVLRGDGTTWAEASPPAGNNVILRAVAPDASGHVWALGTRWSAAESDWRPFVARWDGTAWAGIDDVELIAPDGQLLGMSTAPLGSGWIVGEDANASLAIRGCIDGGGPAGRPADRLAEQGEEESHAQGHAPDVIPRPRAIDPGYRAPRLTGAEPVPGLEARNVAADVGIVQSVHTWGGVVADFDGNGWDDVFISRHIAEPLWLMNEGGVFEEHASGLPVVDRHDCDVGDLDNDQILDVYCALGGERGLGLKVNEALLATRDDPPFAQVATGIGLADPLGRGRRVVLFDADGDGDDDIYLGDQPDRVDALPSTNHLFRNEGGLRFVPWPGAGLDLAVDADCARSYDFDRNGRQDLLMCASHRQGTTIGIRLYRNDGGRFTDITAVKGITPLGEVDALMADFDGDGKLDLAQLSRKRLRISLRRGPRYVPTYERAIQAGRGLAVGTVDTGPSIDLYVVRGTKDSNPKDLMLLNNGVATGFTSMVIPSTPMGSGERAIAIDHDRNGHTDFIVLNGDGPATGPIELIAFFPVEAPPSPPLSSPPGA